MDRKRMAPCLSASEVVVGDCISPVLPEAREALRGTGRDPRTANGVPSKVARGVEGARGDGPGERGERDQADRDRKL